MIDLHTLTTGLVIGESARWHDSRLWFAHWGTQEIAAIGVDGTREVVGNGRPGLGMVVTTDNSTLVVAESFRGQLTAFDIAADGSLSNRRVWADHTGDGICLDAEGAIWCSSMGADGTRVDRVREGGEVLQRVETDLPCFACMLGGEDGKTLFMLLADWRFGEGFENNIRRLTTGPGTGKILATPAPAPRAGWP